VTVPQRSKEFADDYRYFPDPDLPILEIDREWVEELRARLPELPDAKLARFSASYGLSGYDAGVLVSDKRVADYFEDAIATGKSSPKKIANWISGELFRLMKESGQKIDAVQVTPHALVELVEMVEGGEINLSTGKEVLAEMFSSGRGGRQIVEERGLAQISDADALGETVAQVLAGNPEQVREYRNGKTQLFGWLMGQVMKASQGKANPQLVRKLLQAQLNQGPARSLS